MKEMRLGQIERDDLDFVVLAKGKVKVLVGVVVLNGSCQSTPLEAVWKRRETKTVSFCNLDLLCIYRLQMSA